jgi:thiosulfate reductase cytochrome b subunit
MKGLFSKTCKCRLKSQKKPWQNKAVVQTVPPDPTNATETDVFHARMVVFTATFLATEARLSFAFKTLSPQRIKRFMQRHPTLSNNGVILTKGFERNASVIKW